MQVHAYGPLEIDAKRRTFGQFQALIRISAWNHSDTQGAFDRVLGERSGFPESLKGVDLKAGSMFAGASSEVSGASASHTKKKALPTV
jgi:hypothetical protein